MHTFDSWFVATYLKTWRHNLLCEKIAYASLPLQQRGQYWEWRCPTGKPHYELLVWYLCVFGLGSSTIMGLNKYHAFFPWSALTKAFMRGFAGHVLLRCTTCSEFTERIKTARGDERAAVMKAQEAHINMVRQYRCAQTRMNHMSEDATKPGRRDNFDEFIKIDIDACDEAKFKCPRNMANSKNLERLWRPQLHLHGSLIWGVSRLLLTCVVFDMWEICQGKIIWDNFLWGRIPATRLQSAFMWWSLTSRRMPLQRWPFYAGPWMMQQLFCDSDLLRCQATSYWRPETSKE